ncbi:MAG: DUF2339 domain-containing protein [Candidatus Omnitrophota bacterium]
MILFLIWVLSIIGTVVVINRKGLSLWYFFLGLFLGPVGLFITLCEPEPKKLEKISMGSMTLDQAKEQIRFIRNTMMELQKRIEVIENLIIQKTDHAIEQKIEPLQQVQPEAAESIQPPTSPQPQPRTEGFEWIFGQFWLNRIGVVLFVLGVGLFISYTFQYFSALMKIILGYALAVGFLIGGHILEKKEELRKFAWGILAGAWGLLYLTTYALHYIPATRFIENQTIAVSLLLLVSAVTIFYNLKYRSWIVTSLTYVLAFISLTLGGVDASTVWLWAFLVVSIALIAYSFQWKSFLLLGIGSSYIIQLLWLNVALSFTDSQLSSTIGMPMLVISWLTFVVVLIGVFSKEPQDSYTAVTGNLLNSGLFTLAAMVTIYQMNIYHPVGTYRLLLLLALAHAFLAYIYKMFQGEKLIVGHISLMFLFLSMAVFVHCSSLSITICWSVLMLVMFSLGVYYKEAAYRLMASVLGVSVLLRFLAVDLSNTEIVQVLGTVSFQYNIGLGTFLSLIFLGLALVLHKFYKGKLLSREEESLYEIVLPTTSCLLMLCVIGKECSAQWLTIGWIIQGAVTLTIGFLFEHKVLRLSALGVLILAGLHILFIELAGMQTIYKILAVIVVGAVFLGVSYIYTRLKDKQ